MSSSLLERARGFHEDLEIYERAIIEQLENKPRTQKVGQSRGGEEGGIVPPWYRWLHSTTCVVSVFGRRTVVGCLLFWDLGFQRGGWLLAAPVGVMRTCGCGSNPTLHSLLLASYQDCILLLRR